MTAPVRFGRQTTQRPPFQINDLSFSSLPLSLAEEKLLAGAGAGETEVMDALVGALATILTARAEEGATVDGAWLMENLTPGDLEGIVEYLRTGEVAGEVMSP